MYTFEKLSFLWKVDILNQKKNSTYIDRENYNSFFFEELSSKLISLIHKKSHHR